MCLKVFFLYLCLIYWVFFLLFRDINFDKFGESVDYFNNNNILYVFGEYKLVNIDFKMLYNKFILYKKIYLMGF